MYCQNLYLEKSTRKSLKVSDVFLSAGHGPFFQKGRLLWCFFSFVNMPIRMKLPSRYNVAINMKYVTCCEEKKGKRGRNVFNINLI